MSGVIIDRLSQHQSKKVPNKSATKLSTKSSLPIAQLGNPVLWQLAQPITKINAEWVQSLGDRLLTTLLESSGVGIAAPQVSHPYQMLIVASHPNERYPDAPQMEPTTMMNPKLIDHSDKTERGWEGCLSVPGFRGLVSRYQTVHVEYIGLDGHRHRQVFRGFPARIFQHEQDHLNGTVFLDRIDSLHDLMTEEEFYQRAEQGTLPI